MNQGALIRNKREGLSQAIRPVENKSPIFTASGVHFEQLATEVPRYIATYVIT